MTKEKYNLNHEIRIIFKKNIDVSRKGVKILTKTKYLIEKRLFAEAMLYLFAVLEEYLTIIISYYQIISRIILKDAQEKDPDLKKIIKPYTRCYTHQQLSTKSLGELVRIFNEYCPNENLSMQLARLVNLRNKITHVHF